MTTIDPLEHQAIRGLQDARSALERLSAIPSANPRLGRWSGTLIQQITALISEVEALCHAVRNDQQTEERTP